jgi:hypothetical protein
LEGELLERYEEAEEAAPEENKSAFLRSLIVDGLDAKDQDVLDAIDASDELREAVDEHRLEGESLDDAARRLLRQAAESDPRTRPPLNRVLGALGIAVVAATGSVGFLFLGVPGAVAGFALWAVLVAFADKVVDGVGYILEAADAADEFVSAVENASGERADVEERDHEAATDEEPA